MILNSKDIDDNKYPIYNIYPAIKLINIYKFKINKVYILKILNNYLFINLMETL